MKFKLIAKLLLAAMAGFASDTGDERNACYL
jgi:hypothetical protein